MIEIDFQNKEKQEIFVEKRKVSLWEYGLFVIAYKGSLDENLQRNLQELCIEENCLFAQIETLDYFAVPFLPLEENWMKTEYEENISHFQVSKYYKKFLPPYTALIDLTKSEEEILDLMKPKGRYNIRLAEKKWVKVKEVKKTSKNIEIFFKLISETTSRDHFVWNSLKYYTIFLEQKNVKLFFAIHEDNVIAAGIFVQYRDMMYYYYGASSSQKRNLMAPYLLQWNAVKHAKELWCTLYDFLGIAAPDEKDSPLIGVTDFKLKLTADIRKVSESFLYIHKPFRYKLIAFLKYLKK